MSKVCKITGKRPRVANNVSKANNKTKRRQLPNLQSKKIFVPELGKNIKLKFDVLIFFSNNFRYSILIGIRYFLYC